MNRSTTSFVLTMALGSFAHISAGEDVQAQLSAIETASTTERAALIKEFKFELKNMGEEQRIQAMHKIQEKMPEFAQDIQDENVALKINEIKNADPAQRLKLMNSFKFELAQMKEEERKNAITQMQKQMNKEQDSKTEQHKEQVRIQEKVQNEQMDQMQKTTNKEQMNQRQGADQFRQEMINIGSQSNTQGFGQK